MSIHQWLLKVLLLKELLKKPWEEWKFRFEVYSFPFPVSKVQPTPHPQLVTAPGEQLLYPVQAGDVQTNHNKKVAWPKLSGKSKSSSKAMASIHRYTRGVARNTRNGYQLFLPLWLLWLHDYCSWNSRRIQRSFERLIHHQGEQEPLDGSSSVCTE